MYLKCLRDGDYVHTTTHFGQEEYKTVPGKVGEGEPNATQHCNNDGPVSTLVYFCLVSRWKCHHHTCSCERARAELRAKAAFNTESLLRYSFIINALIVEYEI